MTESAIPIKNYTRALQSHLQKIYQGAARDHKPLIEPYVRFIDEVLHMNDLVPANIHQDQVEVDSQYFSQLNKLSSRVQLLGGQAQRSVQRQMKEVPLPGYESKDDMCDSIRRDMGNQYIPVELHEGQMGECQISEICDKLLKYYAAVKQSYDGFAQHQEAASKQTQSPYSKPDNEAGQTYQQYLEAVVRVVDTYGSKAHPDTRKFLNALLRYVKDSGLEVVETSERKYDFLAQTHAVPYKDHPRIFRRDANDLIQKYRYRLFRGGHNQNGNAHRTLLSNTDAIVRDLENLLADNFVRARLETGFPSSYGVDETVQELRRMNDRQRNEFVAITRQLGAFLNRNEDLRGK